MEVKESKGPWFVGDQIDIYNVDSDKVGGGVIAQVWDGFDTPISDMDENIAKANAKLISKAPEMLGMLIKIFHTSEERGHEGCTYGDTHYDSESVCFGYNLALINIKDGIEKLINEATKI